MAVFCENDLDFENELEKAVTGDPEAKEDGSFRALRRKTSLSASHFYEFRSAVQLDEIKNVTSQLNLRKLFETVCLNGDRHWLNPMKELGILDERIARLKGSRLVLKPFVRLLENLAGNEVSPYSFMKFVVLKRMSEDFEWRKWYNRHMESLKIIGKMLCRLKKNHPFTNGRIGKAPYSVVSAIVLCKYAGLPVACLSEEELKRKEGGVLLIERYEEIWSTFSLENPYFIEFYRSGILPFLSYFSGKIGLNNILKIIKAVRRIESLFINYYTDSLFKIPLAAESLYGKNFKSEILFRKERGFKISDYVDEFMDNLSLVENLLKSQPGISLLPFYYNIVLNKRDPEILKNISRLVAIISDNAREGGKRIFIWHTRKMLSFPKKEQENYLACLSSNEGCDPEYPLIEEIFSFKDDLTQGILKRLNKWGWSKGEFLNYVGGADKKNYSKYFTRENFKEFFQFKKPDLAREIKGLQQEIIKGEDREWTEKKIQEIDPFLQKNFYLVLRDIMAVNGFMDDSFQDLFKIDNSLDIGKKYQKYSAVGRMPFFAQKAEFQIPKFKAERISILENSEIQKQLNFNVIKKLWNSFCNPEGYNAEEGKIILGRLVAEYRRTLDFKEDLSDQSRIFIHRQKENLEKVMDVFSTLEENEKEILLILLVPALGKYREQAIELMMKIMVRKTLSSQSIGQKLQVLKEDIIFERLTYAQFSMIFRLLEMIVWFCVQEYQTAVDSLNSQNKESALQAIIPFLSRKKKEIQYSALEGSIKMVFDFGSLNHEKSRWQMLIEKIQNRDSKYYHSISIYTSKSFLDYAYGEMGSICLSMYPDLALHPGFHNIRLVEKNENRIVGMTIAQYVNHCGGYWFAFAFNPLDSFLQHIDQKNQLILYLQIRKIFESLAKKTGKPVLIPGINDKMVISNRMSFELLIRNYEMSKSPVHTSLAKGFSIEYKKEVFENAIVIINPKKPKTFSAELDLKKLMIIPAA